MFIESFHCQFGFFSVCLFSLFYLKMLEKKEQSNNSGHISELDRNEWCAILENAIQL